MPDPRPPNEDLSQVQEYRFLGFRLDLAKRCLYGPGGLPVKLKYRAFDTLAVLVAHRGQTLSKPFLMERVWQKTFVEENNLNQAISNLRKALGDSKDNSRFIKTFSGKGYCFVAPVESITRAEMLQGARPPLFDNFKLASGTYALSPEFSRQAAPFFLVLVACVLIYISVVPGLRESQEEFSTLEISQPAPSPVPVIPPVIPDSVAVLPFETVNSGTDGNAFASGFQNELINQLAKVRELNLISREGVLSPMIQELSLAEVGRILRAEHLVTGTILFSNDDATINVQILNPDNGIIAWASSFMLSTSELPDMLSTYSEIALAIAEALRVEVNLDERQRILSQSTESFEAYRYSLAATNAYYSLDFPQTFLLSKQALALDPEYVDALIVFGKVNSILAATPLEDMNSGEHLRLALEAGERIIELVPEDPNGYLIKAVIQASKHDWEGAMREVERLYAMNTPLSDLPFIATILICLGDFDTAIDILEANLRLEPIDGYGRGFLLTAYESAGKRMEARLEYDLGNELTPLWWGDTVNVFLAMGRDERITDIEDIFVTPAIKNTLYKFNEGDLDFVRGSLDAFLGSDQKNAAELIYYTAFASYLGDHDLAIALMNQAMAEQTLNLNWFWLPLFRKTSEQPGFRDMLDEYGVLDYWEKHGASGYMAQWARP